MLDWRGRSSPLPTSPYRLVALSLPLASLDAPVSGTVTGGYDHLGEAVDAYATACEHSQELAWNCWLGLNAGAFRDTLDPENLHDLMPVPTPTPYVLVDERDRPVCAVAELIATLETMMDPLPDIPAPVALPALSPAVRLLLEEGRRRKAALDEAANRAKHFAREDARRCAEAHWTALLEAIAEDLPGELLPHSSASEMPEDFAGGAKPTQSYDLSIELPGGAPIVRRYEHVRDSWLAAPWKDERGPWAICQWELRTEWDTVTCGPMSLARWTYTDDLLTALAIAEEHGRERLDLEAQAKVQTDRLQTETRHDEPDPGQALLRALDDYFAWSRYDGFGQADPEDGAPRTNSEDLDL